MWRAIVVSAPTETTKFKCTKRNEFDGAQINEEDEDDDDDDGIDAPDAVWMLLLSQLNFILFLSFLSIHYIRR